MVDMYKLQDEVQIISEPREMQAELIALTLWTSFVETMGVGPNDQVARVRLFFNWIASPIEFDEATMSVKVDGRKQNKTNWQV